MKERFHKPLFLFKLLGFFLILLGIHRVIFLILFHDQFSEVAFIEFVKAFLIGTLTDALGWFIIGFTMACILNLSDLGYYPITKKRMGAELLDILHEVPALLGAYLKDYWYLLILLILFLATAFLILKKQFNY